MSNRPHRYLGFNLAGAKNLKTSVAALEYYPKEKKAFLLDIHDRVPIKPDQSSDEALLELISELKGPASEQTLLAFDAPMGLPPCIGCSRKCPMPDRCSVTSVKWMRLMTQKQRKSALLKSEGIRVLEFTPYTQRPIELFLRYQVLPKLQEPYRFEIDETLGGNKAPLTARLHFLNKHFHDLPWIEVNPKLTTSILAQEFGLSKRLIAAYRRLEEGSQARFELIEKFAENLDLFIYDRDLRKISLSLSAFDAFICALTGWLKETHRTAAKPSGFPADWVEYPELKRDHR